MNLDDMGTRPLARCKGLTTNGRVCRKPIYRSELEANGNEYFCVDHLPQAKGEPPGVSGRRLRQLLLDARARAAGKARLDPGPLHDE